MSVCHHCLEDSRCERMAVCEPVRQSWSAPKEFDAFTTPRYWHIELCGWCKGNMVAEREEFYRYHRSLHEPNPREVILLVDILDADIVGDEYEGAAALRVPRG